MQISIHGISFCKSESDGTGALRILATGNNKTFPLKKYYYYLAIKGSKLRF